MSKKYLNSTLLEIDGANYKAYKNIRGNYEFPNFTLIIDYVQGDPFASPSKFRVKIPQSIAKFTSTFYQSSSREIALRDYLARQFQKISRSIKSHCATGKSGLIEIATTGQEILDRTSVLINNQYVEARFRVGLPAQGRRILGRQAAVMLCKDIPKIVDLALLYDSLDNDEILQYVETAEDADYIRDQLLKNNLVAFVANNSVLPRRSGIDFRPLDNNPIPFVSPPELAVEFNCPNRGLIRGMGIREGVTLIVGGGYHGKSTLLQSLELGVYNHIPGDGREFVITNPNAVKIRAEDGRSVAGVDISPFINHLPQGNSTTHFSTTNASGSTSQAANIMEALEAGGQLLLVDEDTSATNFMIRDRRMQALIAKSKEPITPFIDKVRQLYDDYKVSTILVMGGSGDYFEVADTIIAMENYKPYDVTEQAKAIALKYPTERAAEGGSKFGDITPRIPLPQSIDPSTHRRDSKIKTRDINQITFGTEDIDLTAIEQIVDRGQLIAIAAAMVYAKKNYLDGQTHLATALELIMKQIETKGLESITDFPQGDLVRFRRFELAAAINRLRSLVNVS